MKIQHPFKEALPYSFPIMATYIVMGGVFGVMMANAGYNVWISFLMSCVIYAGAMQYVAVSLLAGNVPLFNIIIIALGINARQFFYAIASLKRYKFHGWRKWYLIFSVTDETFAMLNLREQRLQRNATQTNNMINPKSYDNTAKFQVADSNNFVFLESHNQKVMFYISLLNHIYWIIGCVGGTLLGNHIAFIREIKGLDFIVTATFSVLLYENLKNKNNYTPIFIGIFCTTICFFIDKDNFLSYALVSIICVLLILQKYFYADKDKVL